MEMFSTKIHIRMYRAHILQSPANLVPSDWQLNYPAEINAVKVINT